MATGVPQALQSRPLHLPPSNSQVGHPSSFYRFGLPTRLFLTPVAPFLLPYHFLSEIATFANSKKYEDATSNVKSMSDLDDLMSALDQYEDVDTTAPKEVIEANKAAVHHKKLMSWAKRGPSKEEREAAR